MDAFDRWMHAGPPTRPISRRDLLRSAGVGALGLSLASILAACSDDHNAGPSSSAAASPSPLPPIAGELTVAQWPLYIDKSKGRSPSLDMFMKESGIDVDYRTVIDDNQAFFATLVPLFESGQATNWDITALSDWVVNLMRQQGWLETLDWSALPTADETMLDAFRDPAYDPGNAHSVPWQGGVTGIAYYPDLVPGGKIEAFADLWNTELAGHVGMLTEMVDTMTLTLLMLGVDPQTATLDDAARAKDKLLEQRDQGIVRQYVGQGYIDDLVSKNNWASMAWSGDVFYYKELGGAPDLEFVVPSEGGVIWTGPLQIPVQAEHPADATRSWTSTTARDRRDGDRLGAVHDPRRRGARHHAGEGEEPDRGRPPVLRDPGEQPAAVPARRPCERQPLRVQGLRREGVRGIQRLVPAGRQRLTRTDVSPGRLAVHEPHTPDPRRRHRGR
jgi:spermidine/putrescine transport system substrate-binding protein